MRNLIASGLCALICAQGASAQSLSARGNAGNADISKIEEKLNQLRSQLDSASSTIAAMNKCLAEGMFYGPGKPNANATGCVPENDPQVGALQANRTCTSDGSVVSCAYDLESILAGLRSDIDGARVDLASIRSTELPALEARLRAEFDGKLRKLVSDLINLVNANSAEISTSISGIKAQLSIVDDLTSKNKSELGDAFDRIGTATNKIRDILDQLKAPNAWEDVELTERNFDLGCTYALSGRLTDVWPNTVWFGAQPPIPSETELLVHANAVAKNALYFSFAGLHMKFPLNPRFMEPAMHAQNESYYVTKNAIPVYYYVEEIGIILHSIGLGGFYAGGGTLVVNPKYTFVVSKLQRKCDMG